MKVQEIPDSCETICLKRNNVSFHITIFVFSKTKTGIESQGKHCRTQTRHHPKACRLVIKGLELKIQLAALRRRRCPTEVEGPVEKLETSSKMELGTLEKEKKTLGLKAARHVPKVKPRYTLCGKVWLTTPKLKTVTKAGSGKP